MRTLLILAEGANHARIKLSSTHNHCVYLECEAVEVRPFGNTRRRVCQRALACTMMRADDAQYKHMMPTDGVHHAKETSTVLRTAKSLWQSSGLEVPNGRPAR